MLQCTRNFSGTHAKDLSHCHIYYSGPNMPTHHTTLFAFLEILQKTMSYTCRALTNNRPLQHRWQDSETFLVRLIKDRNEKQRNSYIRDTEQVQRHIKTKASNWQRASERKSNWVKHTSIIWNKTGKTNNNSTFNYETTDISSQNTIPISRQVL